MKETEIPPAIYNTPWGYADHIKAVAPGIWFAETPSHGGYFVDRERRRQMPEPLQIDDGWYEEDCHWARVALAFHQIPEFTTAILMAAKDTMRSFYRKDRKDYSEWLKTPGAAELDASIEAYRSANGKLLRHGSFVGGGDGCYWNFSSIDGSIVATVSSKEFIYGIPHQPVSLDDLKQFVSTKEGATIKWKDSNESEIPSNRA